MENYKLVNLATVVVPPMLTNRACERIGGKQEIEHARCERRVRESWWAKRSGVHSVRQYYLPAAVVVVAGNVTASDSVVTCHSCLSGSPIFAIPIQTKT